MPPPSPTSTRTCSARAPTPARASTTSTRSRRRSPAAWPTARCSATTCSRASSRGPDSCPTSRSSRSSRRATTSPRPASIAGRAATGSCCRGCSAGAMQRSTTGRAAALPLLGAWKMLDNLRRTLSAPAGFVALVAGWTLPLARRTRSGRPSSWRPSRCRRCCRSLRRSCHGGRASRCAATCAPSARTCGWPRARRCSRSTFLPHQAWLMADAIGRTLYRLFVSHRNLLEWVTAAQASRRASAPASPASTARWRAASARP